MKATIQLDRVLAVSHVGDTFDRITALVVTSHKDGDYLERQSLLAPRGMFSVGAVGEAVTCTIRLRRSDKYGHSLSIFAISRNKKRAA